MKMLTDRKQIAKEINIKRTTTVRIDLAEADEYGIKSQKVLIENGTYSDGTPSYVHAQICAYSDMKEFTFTGGSICLKSDFGYRDIEEMVEYANAPIVKPDSDVVIVVVDSEKQIAFNPIVMHTGKTVNAYCITPLEFVDSKEEFAQQLTRVIMANVKDEIKNKWHRW